MNKIYVVPTPIGNMDDFTIRSLNILKQVDYILCENINVSLKLKSFFNLKAKFIAINKFNEKSKINDIKEILKKSDIAIISDAGTPTISDPGQYLISELKKNNVQVIPLPGANAITTAISGSGIKFKSFTFLGFLDRTENLIIKSIKQNLNSDLIIAYESPNRINKTLSYIEKNFGNIEIVLARELTKIYEEIIFDNISNLLKRDYKGEIVLLIPTSNIIINNIDDLDLNIKKLLEEGLNSKSILNYLSFSTEYKKNQIYERLKKLK